MSFIGRANFSMCFPVNFLTGIITIDGLLAWAAAHLFKVSMADIACIWIFKVPNFNKEMILLLRARGLDFEFVPCALGRPIVSSRWNINLPDISRERWYRRNFRLVLRPAPRRLARRSPRLDRLLPLSAVQHGRQGARRRRRAPPLARLVRARPRVPPCNPLWRTGCVTCWPGVVRRCIG